jgi:hypothetical protein
MNIQLSRNSGNSAILAAVQAEQDRLSLSHAEEVDGRVNVEYVLNLIQFNLCVICLRYNSELALLLLQE